MDKHKAPIEPSKDEPTQRLTASREQILAKDDEEQEPINKTGRKPVPINWDKVETAMALGCDLKTCAAFGGCHWNTLERRVIERYGEGFREVRQTFLADRKALALGKLWEKVRQGDSKMIQFANRVFNGLNDRPKETEEDDSGESSTFRVAYNLDTPPDVYEAQFREVADE